MLLKLRIFPHNRFYFSDPEAAEPVTIVYRGREDNTTEALFTYKQHSLYGRATLSQRHFVIESVPGDSLVVWVEINQAVWNDERRPPHRELAAGDENAAIPLDRMRELLAQVGDN